MNTHEFDHIIQKKAQQREAAVPADIWEGITANHKKRRRPFFWFMLLLLLLCGSAAVWKLNEKGIADNSVAIQKAKSDKTVASNKEQANSIGATLIIPITIPAENDTEDYVAGTTDRINADAGKVKETHPLVVHTVDDKKTQFQSNNESIENDQRILSESKKQPMFTGSISNDINKKEFASVRKTKRNIKGAVKMHIRNGETEEFTIAEQISDKKELTATSLQAIISRSPAIAPADSEEKPAAEMDVDKINPVLLFAQNDSSQVKKTLLGVEDSSVQKKNNKVNTETAIRKKHNTNVKIEAAIITVVPIQQYKDPVYVKRILNTPGLHSEFISDHVSSTVETGAGVSFNLIKKMNKKWSLGTGIQYIRFTEKLQLSGIETNTSYTIVQRLVDSISGPSLKPDTLSAVTKTTTNLYGRNIYYNFSIPLFARYEMVKKKKWAAALTMGMNIDIVRKYHNDLPGKFETNYISGSQSGESGSTAGLGLSAGFHFSGKLYKKYEWFAASAFNYNITAYKTNKLSFNKNIHLAGISFGIGYQLKK